MDKEIINNRLTVLLQYIFLLWCIVLPWSTAAMQITMLSLVLISILKSVISWKPPIKYHHFYFFLAAYLSTDVISAFLSVNWKSSLLNAFQNDWVIFAVPFLISLPVSPEWRKRAFKGLIISAAVVGIFAVFQFFNGVDYMRGRSMAPIGNFFRATGGYSSFLTFGGNQLFALAIAFAFFTFLHDWSKDKRIYLLSFLIIFLSVIASFTRSSWIGVIFVILLGTYIMNKKVFLYSILVLIVTGTVLFLFIPDLQNRFFSIFDITQNEARVTVWKTSWEIFKNNALFGIGHGNFNQYFEIYKVPGYYDATGHAHNDFFNIAVLNGVIGLIAWLGVWTTWFYFAIKAYSKNIWQLYDRYIILASILGVAGILIASLFQCYYTDLENNIFWWLLISTSFQIIVQSEEKKRISPHTERN